MKKLFFLAIAVFFIGIVLIYQHQSQNLRSNAQEDPNAPGSPAWCNDHCRPEGKSCDFNDTTRTDDPNLNDPCCEDIARTGDPGACPWPQRGYCTDDQCNAIPEGTNRQRCGGPRHGWCDQCRSNNCPGYGSNPVLPTAQPTNLPTTAPPTVPVVQPTTPPAVQPTEINSPVQAEPTMIIVPFMPNDQSLSADTPTPTPTSTLELPAFSLPAFNLPKINIADLNQQTRKPLGLVQFLFETIREYDRRLEEGINGAIMKVMPK